MLSDSTFKRSAAHVAWGIRHGLLLAIAAWALLLPPDRSEQAAVSYTSGRAASSQAAPTRTDAASGLRATFGDSIPSSQVKAVADWIADSRDHHDRPFAVLDKVGARLYVFDSAAALIGSSMVLLGSAIGDDTLASVRDKPLSAIRAEERTTPAGRFVSEAGRDLSGEAVLWVDYDAAVAIHRVHDFDPKERRFERIATSSTEDKRISNGCINVPWGFFDTIAKPVLGNARGVVYVLPDLKQLSEVFPRFYDVLAQNRKSS